MEDKTLNSDSIMKELANSMSVPLKLLTGKSLKMNKKDAETYKKWYDETFIQPVEKANRVFEKKLRKLLKKNKLI